jgi:CheY-like chemotaxis protein
MWWWRRTHFDAHAHVLTPGRTGAQMLVRAPSPERADRPEARPVRCLVAEDNPVMQQVIRGLMQQMGAEITQAFTGTETVRHAEATQYDLIFMDIMMPEMDGSRATHEIRTRPSSRNRDTPIIAFTALGDWKDHAYERVGMNDLLAKPFTRAELFAVFTRWLHRRV